MQPDCVCDDHDQHQAQTALVVHDNVQSRVEHNRLTGDHRAPAYQDESRIEVGGHIDGQVLDEVASAVKGHAPCRNQETPKVQAAALFEGAEDVDVELQDIVVGDADEDDDDDGHGAVGRVEVDHVVGWPQTRGRRRDGQACGAEDKTMPGSARLAMIKWKRDLANRLEPTFEKIDS